MNKQIVGQVGKLKEEKREEYIRLHAAVWSEVLELLQDCNVENYSIFIRGNLVFSYFEYTGEDYEADMNRIAENEVNQKWWSCTKPCFDKLSSDSEESFYEEMEQIFYLK